MRDLNYKTNIEYRDFYKNILNENPENINIGNGVSLGWTEDAAAIFSIFKNIQKNRIDCIASRCRGSHIDYVTTGDASYDREIKDVLDQIKNEYATHGIMMSALEENGIIEIKRLHRDRNNALINGRIWLYQGIYYVSFWNGPRECKQYKKCIDRVLFDILKINKEKLRLEFLGHDEVWYSYDDEFEIGVKEEPKLSPDQIKNLMSKQHLNPKAKKALLDLGELPQNALQKAADSAKISVAQLKSLINRGD